MEEVEILATKLARTVRDVCQFELEQSGQRIFPEQSMHFLAYLMGVLVYL
jgi:hypothetical protein